MLCWNWEWRLVNLFRGLSPPGSNLSEADENRGRFCYCRDESVSPVVPAVSVYSLAEA